MRPLASPVVDDRGLLHSVIENKRLLAAPVIRPYEAAVAQRYLDYVAGQGNPWAIATENQFQPPRASFHAVYASPPKALTFIAELRSGASGACPMCGSDGNGTLDHYLPKSEYPEFSFFSLNLVPACFRCNTLRSAKYAGQQADERPLHPYYDAYGDQRLMTVAIVPPFDIPQFKAIPWNLPAAAADAVTWQIESVVQPAGFARHCQHRWARLLDKPRLHLGTSATPLDVRNQLAFRAVQAEHINESANSWDSCFFHGVSEDAAAVDYLVTAVAASLIVAPLDENEAVANNAAEV
jgi:hypothetical protein